MDIERRVRLLELAGRRQAAAEAWLAEPTPDNEAAWREAEERFMSAAPKAPEPEPDPANPELLEEVFGAEERIRSLFTEQHPDIHDLAAEQYRLLVRHMAGRPGADLPSDHGVVLTMLASFGVRSFAAGLGLLMRGRTWEAQPFERQIVEAVCYMSVVAHEPAAARVWLDKDDPTATDDEKRDRRRAFRNTFDRNPEHRLRHITAARRDFFRLEYGLASESTHNNLRRGASVSRLTDAGAEVHLIDVDPDHAAFMTLSFLDLGQKAAAEMNEQWRAYDSERAYDTDIDLLAGQRAVLFNKYRRLFRNGQYGINLNGEFARRPDGV